MQETGIQSLGQEDPLEEIMATYSSILAWRIPWTEEPGHCRQILYQLSHQRSPRILEWVTYPFSSGSSQPRNQTGVSCIAGGFFTN